MEISIFLINYLYQGIGQILNLGIVWNQLIDTEFVNFTGKKLQLYVY